MALFAGAIVAAIVSIATMSTPTMTDLAVVELRVMNGGELVGRGHGVVVDEQTVLTCWHVAAIGDRVDVVSRSGRRIEAYALTAADVRRDLVALRLERRWQGPSATVEARGLAVDASVSVGMHQGWRDTPRRPSVKVLKRFVVPGDVPVIEIDAPSRDGISGAPVFDPQGRVIGLITSSMPNQTALVTLLEGWSIQGPPRALAAFAARHEPLMLADRWRESGNDHRKRNQWSTAIDCYENAILYDPLDWRAMNSLAWCLTQLDRMPEALIWRKRLLTLVPDFPDFWAIYAIELLIAERRAEALEAAKQAEARCEWRHLEALHTTRYVYSYLGEHTAARRLDEVIGGRARPD